MITFISSLFVFLFVITIHEAGHFFAAKFSGIAVNEFSIGMGPAIFSRRKNETLYSLRAFPLGGYCAMEGEDEPTENPHSFQNASLKKRIFVVISGALMNFILALVVFFIIFFMSGTQTTTIKDVVPGSPAQKAGIVQGDKIHAINGVTVESWNEVIEKIGTAQGKISLEIHRSGEKVSLELTPVEEEGRQVIGIIAETVRSIPLAIKSSIQFTVEIVASLFIALKGIFAGTLGTEQLAGPVGVISIIGQSAKMGFASLLFIMGLISANVGIFNLLPIPALDGGRLFFLLLEGIRGKKINQVWEQRITIAGMVFLLSLMLYITIFSDVKRILEGV